MCHYTRGVFAANADVDANMLTTSIIARIEAHTLLFFIISYVPFQVVIREK